MPASLAPTFDNVPKLNRPFKFKRCSQPHDHVRPAMCDQSKSGVAPDKNIFKKLIHKIRSGPDGSTAEAPSTNPARSGRNAAGTCVRPPTRSGADVTASRPIFSTVLPRGTPRRLRLCARWISARENTPYVTPKNHATGRRHYIFVIYSC